MAKLKKLPAIEMVRAMKRYKESFKTFQYMTSPYVYPITGIGSSFAKASAKVLATNNGISLVGRPIDCILYDASGRACGVTSEGVSVNAGCVISAPEHVPEAAEEAYSVVRMYAVLSHAPHKCKDARSCRLLIPGSQVGRKHGIHLVCSGPAHRIAPGDKWLVVLSTRVEGPTEGLTPLQVAKREFEAAIPLLRPTRKIFAELSPVLAAREECAEGLHVLSSLDETSTFDSVVEDVQAAYEKATGEPLNIA